jgi:hypothetical protein
VSVLSRQYAAYLNQDTEQVRVFFRSQDGS